MEYPKLIKANIDAVEEAVRKIKTDQETSELRELWTDAKNRLQDYKTHSKFLYGVLAANSPQRATGLLQKSMELFRDFHVASEDAQISYYTALVGLNKDSKAGNELVFEIFKKDVAFSFSEKVWSLFLDFFADLARRKLMEMDLLRSFYTEGLFTVGLLSNEIWDKVIEIENSLGESNAAIIKRLCEKRIILPIVSVPSDISKDDQSYVNAQKFREETLEVFTKKIFRSHKGDQESISFVLQSLVSLVKESILLREEIKQPLCDWLYLKTLEHERLKENRIVLKDYLIQLEGKVKNAANDTEKKLLKEKTFRLYETAIRRHPLDLKLIKLYLAFLEKQGASILELKNTIKSCIARAELPLKEIVGLTTVFFSILIRKFHSQKGSSGNEAKIEEIKSEFRGEAILLEEIIFKKTSEKIPKQFLDALVYMAFVELKYFKNTEKARIHLDMLIQFSKGDVKSWKRRIKFEKYNGDAKSTRVVIMKALKASEGSWKDLEEILWVWKKAIWHCWESVQDVEADFLLIEQIEENLRQIKISQNNTRSKRFKTDRKSFENPPFKRQNFKKSAKNVSKIFLKSQKNRKNQTKLKNSTDLSKINKKQHQKKMKNTPDSTKSDKTLKSVNLPGKTQKGQKSTIFIVNIAKSVSAKDLSELFGHYGKIKSLKLPKNTQGEPRGYAYVHFKDDNSADKSIKALNNMKFHNRLISVTLVRSNENTGKTIFVRKLPKSDCREELERFFERFGPVAEIRRPSELKGGALKPFCYVRFSSEASANAALSLYKDGKVPSFLGKSFEIQKCLVPEKTGAKLKKRQEEMLKGKSVEASKDALFTPTVVLRKRKRISGFGKEEVKSNGDSKERNEMKIKTLTNQDFKSMFS